MNGQGPSHSQYFFSRSVMKEKNGQPSAVFIDAHVSLLPLLSNVRCMIIASPFHMQSTIAAAAMVAALSTMMLGQTPPAVDLKLQAQLKQLFPAAAAFSPKVPDPPHYKAYAANPAGGSQTVAGIAFWTTEIEPLERGYDGPIKILVGMVAIMSVLIVQATIQFAVAILAEAGLSYLGLGAQPPVPSWGRMLRDAQTYIFQAPELAVWPGLAIALAVLGLNMLGDGLRDLLDPRLRLLRVG